MIVATRLNAVWRVAGVAAAALCCYLVSQSVASERGALEKVDRQIAETHDDIAKLQTEIGVRARQGQLEAWNRDVLALQAPRPSQFVASGVQLASLYGHHGQPALQLDPAIASQQGSPTNVAYRPVPSSPAPAAAPPAADAPAPASPMLRAASYVRPAPSRLGDAPAAGSPATVQKASFEMIRTAAPATHHDSADASPGRLVVAAKASESRAPKIAEGKLKAEPIRLAVRDALPKSLLPADISALAAREAKGAKDSTKAARWNAPAALRIDRAERVEVRDTAAVPSGALGIAQQRLMGLMLLFVLITAVIALRLVQICLFGGPDTRSAAAGIADRGEITDRNGQPLATTIKLWAIAINPQKVLGNKDKLAAELNQLMPERSVADYERILHGKRKFMYLRQPAPPELAAAVHALGEPGMLLLSEQHRLFPQGAMAGHLLGYSQVVEAVKGKPTITGIGVERYFDDDLKAGKSIQLSVDTRVQAAVENEIARRMAETQAKGGAGIVMDVNTGEILAMASLPDINPNAPFKGVDPSDQQVMINKATQAVYELGSTFKMITFANAIEHNVITDWSKTYVVSAPIQVGRFRIKDDEPKHRPITTVEIMTFSSNIGTSQIALALGAQNIDAFFKTLGLDKRTDIELRERGQPQYPAQWGQSAVMTTSFGHGIAVTPLHLARVFAALANGGVMHPVTLLKKQPGAQIPGQRVVSEATSARMRQLMRLVVLQGTGTNAGAAGLRVGGKTGTAEKVNQFGGYDRNANITAFAGVFPIDHPRYVTLVVLDDARPTKESKSMGFKTAGWMAAPLAKRIIARIGPLLGVQPDLSQDIDVSDLVPLILDKKDPSKNVVE